MSKVADCKFSWAKSVSTDVVKVTAILVQGGVTQRIDMPTIDVESFEITFSPNSSGTFSVESMDNEGHVTVSETITWSVGDLVAPAPATNLKFEVVQIRDIPDPVPV